MRIYFTIVLLLMAVTLTAQPPMQRDFLSFQKSFTRVSNAFFRTEDLLKAEFSAKGLKWPANYMYIRSFKYDSKLEIWVKDKATDPYKKFKTYQVCALAGALGPKRYEGDYQVPEGFYYVNQFRHNSNYHLALGVNYPNASDRILSDQKRPGAEIYIHGSCVTVGCIPLTDPIIEELYVLAASSRAAGQDFIPIHVFPVIFKREKSKEILDKYLENRPDYKPLAYSLEKAYYYFEVNKQLPTILINAKGEYSLAQEFTIPKKAPPPPKFKENTAARNTGVMTNIPEADFFSFVHSQPVFPGGMQAFQAFIDALGEDLIQFLPEQRRKAYIPVEFVVNTAGKVVNVKVDKAANNEMNNFILERFQNMPAWAPALRQDKAVPIRLSQTIMVVGEEIVPKKPNSDDDDD